MKCHVCGTENPDDAFFCGSCGAQMSSLLDSPSGPIEEISGDIEIKPLIDQPGEVQPQPPLPPPSATTPPRMDVNAPSAGLEQPGPPPPAGAQPPPPPPAYPGAQPAPYQPPPAAPQYGQPGGYPPGYAPYQPQDGNTSGMGPGYPTPPEASGWTFAGCVPYGLFAFFNGSILWGILGIVLNVFSLGLIYIIYIGIQGRDLAWRNRRFTGVPQFVETMNAWNTWGLVLGIIGIVGMVLYFIFFIAMIAASEM
jgi:hypothetical protein